MKPSKIVLFHHRHSDSNRVWWKSCFPGSGRKQTLCGIILTVIILTPLGLFLTVVAPQPPLSNTVITLSDDNGVQTAFSSRPVHFIYTIGCGGASDPEWQLLQSNALDASFELVRQRGKLTRLVSGCVEDRAKQEYISRSVYSQLDTVFMPSQESVNVEGTKRTYVQANRPTALRLFFSSMKDVDEETVFIVLDPDFVFRKQFPEEDIEEVREGHLVTHAYALADPTSYAYQACLEAFVGTPTLQQCEVIKSNRSFRRWNGGVPYALVRSDWLKLLHFWIPLIGPVLLRYPGIESDMLSWAIAAALAGLTAGLKPHFMATCMSSEKADVNSVLDKQVFLHLCQSYYVPETRGPQYLVNHVASLPHIVSSRFVEKDSYIFVFNKHWLHKSKLLEDCTVPLLALPPPQPSTPMGPDVARHYAWHRAVLEEAISSYNRAITLFRQRILKCDTQPLEGMVLIMHERHRHQHNDRWNHVVQV